MDFYKVVDDVLALLRGRGRVTYRALKVQFQLDDEQLEALKEEIIYAKRLAVGPRSGDRPLDRHEPPKKHEQLHPSKIAMRERPRDP
jgi:hypothetical protein